MEAPPKNKSPDIHFETARNDKSDDINEITNELSAINDSTQQIKKEEELNTVIFF